LAVEKGPEEGAFHWKLIDGNIEINTGSFQLIEKSTTRTQIKMEARVDAGGLWPQWLVNWTAENFLPKAIRALGDRLASAKASIERTKAPLQKPTSNSKE
jgi:hypothetical protein